VARRFIVIGQKATAGDEFLLDDLPGTSGRLDVLVRCLRPAFLSSHGIRRDVVVYLVLLGGPRAPRVLRVMGADVKFLRPDERALAILVKKVLASHADEAEPGFVVVKPGIAVAKGGLDMALDDVLASAPGGPLFVLDESARDLRRVNDLGAGSPCFVIGDHLGIPDDARMRLAVVGALPVSIGPVSVHADDVLTIVTNELDRADENRGGSGKDD
jgi:tRNA (pseudouridine54-N1)-methyltransferase